VNVETDAPMELINRAIKAAENGEFQALDAKEKQLEEKQRQGETFRDQNVKENNQLEGVTFDDLLQKISNLEKENKKLKTMISGQERLCVFCQDKPCEYAILSCGHFCCCKDCIKPIRKLGKCPMCRQNVDKFFKVFI
jgi:hypothetical protein